MDFVYADELKQQFKVVGQYYELRLSGRYFPCRRVADIYDFQTLTAAELEQHQPQGLVIMMNPGSSSPEEETVKPQKFGIRKFLAEQPDIEWVSIRPDNTQYQMMRLMKQQGWEHLRIINLSDLREGNSGNFANDFKLAASLNAQHPHSYLHPKRQAELLSLAQNAQAVIAAWGTNPVQAEQAQACIDLMSENGIELHGSPLQYPWYRFASPYRKDQKLSWLQEIHQQLL